MKRFLQYALALTTVLLLTAVAPEAYAQNRAHNNTKNNTTQTTKQSGSKPSEAKPSGTKPSGTTASDRSKKPTVTTGSSTKPASSTPSKPSAKPESKPSNQPSGSHSGSHSGSSSTKPSSKPSSQPSNHQPSAKPDNKPSGSHSGSHGVKVGGDDHKGNTPKPGTSHNPGSTKPSSHSSSHNPGHKPDHKPDHKPGKYTGHYESHPTPGHDYGHHMPDRIDRKPGLYHPKPNYHHADHYFGHFINTLPRGYHSRRYNKIRYYYYDGIYYRRVNGYYCICRPPFGVKIAMNLFGIIPAPVWFSPNARYIYNDCYCWDGVFYRLRGRYYHVIEPPIVALCPQIPADYEIVMMNGSTCYRVEDTLYQMVVLDGRIWFEVIANLAPRYY